MPAPLYCRLCASVNMSFSFCNSGVGCAGCTLEAVRHLQGASSVPLYCRQVVKLQGGDGSTEQHSAAPVAVCGVVTPWVGGFACSLHMHALQLYHICTLLRSAVPALCADFSVVVSVLGCVVLLRKVKK
jgi:hypothetical protein